MSRNTVVFAGVKAAKGGDSGVGRGYGNTHVNKSRNKETKENNFSYLYTKKADIIGIIY